MLRPSRYLSRCVAGLHASSDELLHLDLLRFAASCAIVLLHFAPFLSPGARVLLGKVDGLSIFVDLFFVISGFVIAYVYAGRLNDRRDYAVFLRRRVARLLPLHWATLLFYVGVATLVWSGRMPSDHPAFYDPDCLLPNMLAIHAWGMCDTLSFNVVSWSISAEMAMYVIAPLLLVAARRSPAALLAGALLVIAALSRAPQQPWLEWTWHVGVARALPGFAIGIVLASWRTTIARHLPAPRVVAVAALALLLVGVRGDWPLVTLLPFVWLTVAATIAADLGGRYRPPRLGALGQLTYGIYMLHPLVRTVVISFVGHHLRLHGIALDLLVVAGAALTLVAAYASFTLFETPARRWLSRGRARAAVAQPA